jgi:hypothetical protein
MLAEARLQAVVGSRVVTDANDSPLRSMGARLAALKEKVEPVIEWDIVRVIENRKALNQPVDSLARTARIGAGLVTTTSRRTLLRLSRSWGTSSLRIYP